MKKNQEVMSQSSKKVGGSSDVWTKESEYALRLYRVVFFQAIGICSFNCENFAPTCLFLWSCFTQVSMIITICGELLITGLDDLQSISSMSCNVLSMIKTLMIQKNRLKMKQILEILIGSWHNDENFGILKIMKNNARLWRLFLIYQLPSTYSAVLPTIFGSVPMSDLNINRTLNETNIILVSFPIPSANLFSWIPSSFYWILFLYESFQLMLTITANVGTDCWFSGIVMNLTALFECLPISLQNHNNENKIQQMDLKSIIPRQIMLIEMVTYLEEIFSIIILSVVLVNVSQVCFYGIQMIGCIRADDITIGVQTEFFIIVLIFQIFVYSCASGRISSEIASFRDAAYHCQWEEMQLKNQKDLRFIMIQTERLFSLTADGIYRMDFYNSKDIIKAIGSYFSVMQAMFHK